MKQIKVVVDGVAPILITANAGCFLRVDSESSNYFKVTAYKTSKVLGVSWRVSKKVVAGFAINKLVLWTEVT